MLKKLKPKEIFYSFTDNLFMGRNIKNVQRTFGINDVNNLKLEELKNIFKNFKKFSRKDILDLITVLPKFALVFVNTMNNYQNTQDKLGDAVIKSGTIVFNNLEYLSKKASSREEREKIADIIYYFGKEHSELLIRIAEANSKTRSNFRKVFGFVGFGTVLLGLYSFTKKK